MAANADDRPEQIYTRPEFVRSLTVPVISSSTSFNLWRDQDELVLRALFD